MVFKIGYVFDMKQTNASPEKMSELLKEEKREQINKEKNNMAAYRTKSYDRK